MNIVILDGYRTQPGDLSWDKIYEVGTVEVYDRTSPQDVVERARHADILLTNKTELNEALLSQLPNCKFISVLATGYNVVDIVAAKAQGIAVSNVPAYSTHEVAQFTIALLLSLCHRVGLHHQAVQQGEWERQIDFSFWLTPQTSLFGKTLSILGLGKIGQQTGRIAAALGMRVLASGTAKASDPTDYPVTRCSIESCIQEADVLSLHLPLTAQTRHMINEQRLLAMKSSAWLINTSRGDLIDEVALGKALLSGNISAAAVDVVSSEPIPKNHPLLGISNCIITPHMAWASREARERLISITSENIRQFQNGTPVNLAN